VTKSIRGGDARYNDALARLIAERFRQLWTALPRALDSDDAEAVHDIRVASRRLRAAMDVGVDCFPASWFRPLHQLAKDVTSRLGEVRDREVLLAYFQTERASAPPAELAGIDRLTARLSSELEHHRTEMERFLRDIQSSSMVTESVRRFGRSARPRQTVSNVSSGEVG
jgi:CHAD domain-containing protein